MDYLIKGSERHAYGFYDYRVFWGSKEDMPWGNASWWLQVCCGLEGPICPIIRKDLAPIKET